jgi:hypothetical protein
MSELWDSATQHIWLVNDLYSGKKEVAQGNASLVPLLFSASGGDLQATVNAIVGAVRASIDSFDESAARLRAKCGQDIDTLRMLDEYLECCRLNCTGNLGWSLVTGRYGMEKTGIDDGSCLLSM